MRVDGNAAAIVGDGQEAVGLELDLDPGGVAGHGLVHAIVDHLGEKVMQRLLVGAADIHARPAPHGLEALEHLDVGGGVAFGRFGWLTNGASHWLVSRSLLLLLIRDVFRLGNVFGFRDELQARLRFGQGCFGLGAFGAVRLAEQIAQGAQAET